MFELERNRTFDNMKKHFFGLLAALGPVFLSGCVMAAELTCTLPTNADPAAQQVCDAVRAQMTDAMPDHLELVFTLARPTEFQAHMRWGQPPQRTDGPVLGMSVMDRSGFTPAGLRHYATALLASIK